MLVSATTRPEPTGTVGPLAFEPGQTVLVAYDAANPADAVVADTGYSLQLFLNQTFIGLMFIVIALLIFLFNGNLAWLGPTRIAERTVFRRLRGSPSCVRAR
jgi:hypothetical protein